jgi:diguanylate cyclase (GGDEF)-like protein
LTESAGERRTALAGEGRSPASVLIVDDDAQSRKVLVAMLGPEQYRIQSAATGEDALAAIARQPPDLVLLDIALSGIDGFEVAASLKSNPATANIPIIMVTARHDRASRIDGLAAGAEDFLSKPVDRVELWLRVRNLLRLKELSDALQQEREALETQVAERTADLQHLAYHDPMTGLPNRILFYDALRKTLELADAKHWLVAVMFIDLDRLKNVNDSFGHGVGDELLAQFGHRLLQCVRLRDTVGRISGDEFGLILPMDDPQGAAVVAERVRQALLVPFDLRGHEVTVTASVGITIYPTDATDPEALITCADQAMYHAKQAGRDTSRFFTAELNAEHVAQLDLEHALRRAIENHEFVLHYQPKVHLGSGQITGVEALLRWQRPGYGLVMPAAFVPTLEDTGLIVRVGGWVIAEACHQIAEWERSDVGSLQVAVNVSARQFIEGDLERAVNSALEDSGVAPQLLELELTESSMMANTALTVAKLERLRARGVRISIDDFGTGYSSLAYLRRFPVDKLKIDIAFIRDLITNPGDASIALTIIRMAHGLKLDVIAEGVETAAQLAYLRSHHCDEIQGYLISQPLPAQQLAARLRTAASLLPPTELVVPGNTLLLVDGDPEIRSALEKLLCLDGYRILSAASAEHAFELLAAHRVQVILCEHRLPALTGTDFLDRVKDLHPDTLRIVLSGQTDLDALMKAINQGAIHRYYTKPWDDNTLRANIRDAFHRYWLLDDAKTQNEIPPSIHAAEPR